MTYDGQNGSQNGYRHTFCLRLWQGMQERTLLLRGSPLVFCDWAAIEDIVLSLLPPTPGEGPLHDVTARSGGEGQEKMYQRF